MDCFKIHLTQRQAKQKEHGTLACRSAEWQRKKEREKKKIRKRTIDGSSGEGISVVSGANESRDEEKGDSFAEERWGERNDLATEDISNRSDNKARTKRHATINLSRSCRDFFVNQQFSRVSGNPLPPLYHRWVYRVSGHRA